MIIDMTKPSFSVDTHDSDGFVYEEGVYIHLGPIALHFEKLKDLEIFANVIVNAIIPEIRVNYPDRFGEGK
jgi:hypothetical protein